MLQLASCAGSAGCTHQLQSSTQAPPASQGCPVHLLVPTRAVQCPYSYILYAPKELFLSTALEMLETHSQTFILYMELGQFPPAGDLQGTNSNNPFLQSPRFSHVSTRRAETSTRSSEVTWDMKLGVELVARQAPSAGSYLIMSSHCSHRAF